MKLAVCALMQVAAGTSAAAAGRADAALSENGPPLQHPDAAADPQITLSAHPSHMQSSCQHDAMGAEPTAMMRKQEVAVHLTKTPLPGHMVGQLAKGVSHRAQVHTAISLPTPPGSCPSGTLYPAPCTQGISMRLHMQLRTSEEHSMGEFRVQLGRTYRVA